MTSIFKKLSPDVMVADVTQTVIFYTEKLGFTLAMLVPENSKAVETALVSGRSYVYAMVKRDDIFLMFMRKDVYEDDIPALAGVGIGASAVFYCEVDNVSGLYDDFKNKRVDIVKDISTAWYGMKEFYIRDCNGYILGFAERVCMGNSTL